MSKRAAKRVRAAEEVCRALRLAFTSAAEQNARLAETIDYLQVWMRHSGKACYDPPKPLRKVSRISGST